MKDAEKQAFVLVVQDGREGDLDAICRFAA
jgi:hypothetical protein